MFKQYFFSSIHLATNQDPCNFLMSALCSSSVAFLAYLLGISLVYGLVIRLLNFVSGFYSSEPPVGDSVINLGYFSSQLGLL